MCSACISIEKTSKFRQRCNTYALAGRSIDWALLNMLKKKEKLGHSGYVGRRNAHSKREVLFSFNVVKKDDVTAWQLSVHIICFFICSLID